MALDDEINSCSYREDAGPRLRSRPQQFCDDVTIQGALTAEGNSSMAEVTASSVEIEGPSITVNGMTFVPMLVNTLDGPLTLLAVAPGP